MSDYIETIVGDGKILIEVGNIKGGVGFVKSKSDEADEKAEQAFGQAMNTIKLAAETVLQTLDGLSERPDAVKVDFAIKIDEAAGAMLARADSRDAQLRVSLGWNKSPEKEEDSE